MSGFLCKTERWYQAALKLCRAITHQLVINGYVSGNMSFMADDITYAVCFNDVIILGDAEYVVCIRVKSV